MQIRMLREIDRMFDGVPQTRKTLEAKEEMLQNLMEKFEDLTAQGKSEEAAFNIAIASVGDISDLLEELNDPPPEVARFDDETDYAQGSIAPDRAAAASTHDRALVVSVSVMMYILSPVALILVRGRMGTLLMLVMMALATGMLIYNGMTRPKAAPQAEDIPAPAGRMADEEEVKPGKRSKRQRRFMASMSGALWMITVALYFVISFATGAWHISWIIYLIAAAAEQVMRAFVDLYWGR